MQFSSIVAAFTFALAASAVPIVEERADSPTCSAENGSPKCCNNLQKVQLPIIGGLIDVIAGIGCVNAVNVVGGICTNNQKVQCCKASSAPALIAINALQCVAVA